MEIIDKIKNHINDNPVDIANIIIENGFNVSKGLVYSLDENTIVKRVNAPYYVADAIQRVNSVVPDFIKDFKLVPDNQIELYLTRYHGQHPMQIGVVKDKNHALTILNTCIDFVKKAKPYTMNDFCAGNIIINGDDIHIVDLDQIFYNDIDETTVKDYYRKMNWIKNWISYNEFENIWTKHF